MEDTKLLDERKQLPRYIDRNNSEQMAQFEKLVAAVERFGKTVARLEKWKDENIRNS